MSHFNHPFILSQARMMLSAAQRFTLVVRQASRLCPETNFAGSRRILRSGEAVKWMRMLGSSKLVPDPK